MHAISQDALVLVALAAVCVLLLVTQVMRGRARARMSPHDRIGETS